MIFLELFWTFLKIGAFTIGGGYAMLPMVQDEVIAQGWMNETALVDFIAVSESTPGPFAVNIATYIGTETGGLFGAFCATLGVVLPSFFCILIIAKSFVRFQNSAVVKGCMAGLKPAVISLIGASVISVATTVFAPAGISHAIFFKPSFYVSLVILAVSLILAFKKAHPIFIICLSALLGILGGYLII